MTITLTRNFQRSEFACECGCGFDTADFLLVQTLQDERDYFESIYGRVRLVITGRNRCKAHNAATPGAAPNSTHTEGKAADHHIDRWLGGKWVRIDPQEQYDYLDSSFPDSCGIGLYSNRVHFDTRAAKARWDKT